MDVRKVIILVGAVLIAGVTAFFARSMFAGAAVSTATAAPAPEIGTEVLVAVKPLPIGTIVTAEHFAFRPWPKDMVEKAYFLKSETDPATLVGKVVRHTVTAGQPVTQGALVGPGESGFLAAALGPGMRAVTVHISDTSSVGGFIFPGDRVDLLLTQEVPGEGTALRVAETVMRNLRVLAIDQNADTMSNQPKVGRTLTIEVTPKLAEKIAVAQTLGVLSLTLRAIADNAAELERAIAAGEVEVKADQDEAADRAMERAIARMPTDANPTFTTGGEVSRFQRSTAPAPRAAAPAGTATGPASVPSRPRGPVVTITRGGRVTAVPVGA